MGENGRNGNSGYRWLSACLLAAGLLVGFRPSDALAQRISPELEARLSESQLRQYRTHLQAKSAFDGQLDEYWDDVEEKRQARRSKRANGQSFSRRDYMLEQPPKYS